MRAMGRRDAAAQCRREGRRDVAALLLDKGADREARDSESGATPLYHAAAWGRTALVELLVARGAASMPRIRPALRRWPPPRRTAFPKLPPS